MGYFMKKLIILSIFIFLLLSCFPSFAKDKNVINNKKSKYMTLSEYLYSEKTEEDMKYLKLNDKGEVIYKNKIILDYNGHSITDETSGDSYLLLKIYLVASGAKPKENCDETDYFENGIYGLGCYIDIPDD